MVNLTLSEDGIANGRDVHKAEQISTTRTYTAASARNEVVLTLDDRDGFGLACDLLYQLVDSGMLAGWNVQLPEREDAVAYLVLRPARDAHRPRSQAFAHQATTTTGG